MIFLLRVLTIISVTSFVCYSHAVERCNDLLTLSESSDSITRVDLLPSHSDQNLSHKPAEVDVLYQRGLLPKASGRKYKAVLQNGDSKKQAAIELIDSSEQGEGLSLSSQGTSSSLQPLGAPIQNDNSLTASVGTELVIDGPLSDEQIFQIYGVRQPWALRSRDELEEIKLRLNTAASHDPSFILDYLNAVIIDKASKEVIVDILTRAAPYVNPAASSSNLVEARSSMLGHYGSFLEDQSNMLFRSQTNSYFNFRLNGDGPLLSARVLDVSVLLDQITSSNVGVIQQLLGQYERENFVYVTAEWVTEDGRHQIGLLLEEELNTIRVESGSARSQWIETMQQIFSNGITQDSQMVLRDLRSSALLARADHLGEGGIIPRDETPFNMFPEIIADQYPLPQGFEDDFPNKGTAIIYYYSSLAVDKKRIDDLPPIHDQVIVIDEQGHLRMSPTHNLHMLRADGSDEFLQRWRRSKSEGVSNLPAAMWSSMISRGKPIYISGILHKEPNGQIVVYIDVEGYFDTDATSTIEIELESQIRVFTNLFFERTGYIPNIHFAQQIRQHRFAHRTQRPLEAYANADNIFSDIRVNQSGSRFGSSDGSQNTTQDTGRTTAIEAWEQPEDLMSMNDFFAKDPEATEFSWARWVFNIENTDTEVVRSRYRELIRTWHPDTNAADQDRMSRVTVILNEAYSILR